MTWASLAAPCECHSSHSAVLFISKQLILRHVRKLHKERKVRSLYSKVVCDLRAASDHSVDNSTAMLQEWLKGVQHLYHSVEWRPGEQPR